MLAIIARYGIAALAAALTALSGGEASGCGGHCGRRACCEAAPICNGHGFHIRDGRGCDCCPHGAEVMGVHASSGMECGVVGPSAAPPMPPFLHARHRPPVVVPPGTLGRTYHQISRLLPECEHPRTAMIELCDVPAGMQVTIVGMEGYLGVNGVWYFRTIQPLLPCTPSIYTAYICSPFGVSHAGVNYRAFRLIEGRIVSLRW